MRNTEMKIVVFDLDETLGQFYELGMFCDAVESYNKKKLNFKEFYEIMDIFPEFIRPNMLKILLYLKEKKNKGECNKIIIYTNNQGPKEWAINIKNFMEKKLNAKIFDQIIAAYKVGGVVIEPKRTRHDKSLEDLLSCTNLSNETKICFLDDVYHPLMDRDTVHYINVKVYNCTIPFNEMAEKYYKHFSHKIGDKQKFIKYITNQMNKYSCTIHNKSINEKQIDALESTKIHKQLRDFFKVNKKKQTRKKNQKRKKTRTYKI